ncbi:MAG: flagellar hook-basal body complex protein, partial [Thiopseudomonas sp.]|nr:flagellar hook-basal body complex protein [Thiopseudomonas sp.]
LEFDASGKMITPASGQITYINWTPRKPDPNNPGSFIPNGAGGNNGAVPASFELDMSGTSQFASPFAVTKVVQDGYSIGELSGVEIDDTGMIFARYTNNQSRVQGQVVLANFANVQGLQPVGKTQWVETQESGPVVLNPGTVGNNGAIQAGALEESNVEISDQLIQLIVAQRNYQANAKTIETQSAITQTIINMR